MRNKDPRRVLVGSSKGFLVSSKERERETERTFQPQGLVFSRLEVESEYQEHVPKILNINDISK